MIANILNEAKEKPKIVLSTDLIKLKQFDDCDFEGILQKPFTTNQSYKKDKSYILGDGKPGIAVIFGNDNIFVPISVFNYESDEYGIIIRHYIAQMIRQDHDDYFAIERVRLFGGMNGKNVVYMGREAKTEANDIRKFMKNEVASKPMEWVISWIKCV